MKPLLGVVGGFVVSLGMFVGGLAAAVFLLTAEPDRQLDPSRDVADLWTGEPRKVDVAAQDFERLPALQIPPKTNPTDVALAAAMGNIEAASGAVDAIATSSMQTAANEGPEQQALDHLPSAHAEWCASHYRSYRPDEDSYTHYSGAIRPCVSPYSEEQEAAAERVSPALLDPDNQLEFVDDPSSPPLQYALNDEDGSFVASDHASYCFSRYRSYRPEDNTYQPYGGGPRRQCR